MDAEDKNMDPDRASARATGVVSRVASLIGRGRPPAELLAERFTIADRQVFIDSVTQLSQTTSRVPDRAKFKIWGPGVVYDTNPIHLDEQAARAFPLAKLETTPTYGTMIIAMGEQYIQEVLSEINLRLPAKIYCLRQRAKFQEPLYPGERLSWELDSVNGSEGVELVTKGRTEGGKEIATLTASLGTERRVATTAELEAILSDFGYYCDFPVTRKTVEDFYGCIGTLDLGEVRDSLPVALGIAALLNFSLKKTGKLDGIYRSMDVELLSPPSLGTYRIFLLPPSVKGSDRKGYISQTGVIGVHRESKRPIYSGKITGISQTSPF